jgi:hypothetical protein
MTAGEAEAEQHRLVEQAGGCQTKVSSVARCGGGGGGDGGGGGGGDGGGGGGGGILAKARGWVFADPPAVQWPLCRHSAVECSTVVPTEGVRTRCSAAGGSGSCRQRLGVSRPPPSRGPTASDGATKWDYKQG